MFEFSFESLFKKCFRQILSPVHHISSFLEVDAKILRERYKCVAFAENDIVRFSIRDGFVARFARCQQVEH